MKLTSLLTWAAGASARAAQFLPVGNQAAIFVDWGIASEMPAVVAPAERKP